MIRSTYLPAHFISSKLQKALRVKQNTPNLSLNKILVDQHNSFEMWTPKWTPKGLNLAPIEIQLLKQDQFRLSQILAKMVWLMGAICLAEDEWEVGDRQRIYSWDSVIEFVKHQGRCLNPIVTNIIFRSHSFSSISDLENQVPGNVAPQAWEISPPHWTIIFDNLVSVNGVLQLQPTAELITVEIWTGKPIRRELRGGKFYIQYYDRHAKKRHT